MTLQESRRKYEETYPERVRESKRRYREANRDTIRAKARKSRDPAKQRVFSRKCRLKLLYGLTPEAYDLMLQAQKGVCAICGRPETAVCNGSPASLSVDHCHASGRVRGLLCIRCNRGLQAVEWHESAIHYLRNTLENDEKPKGVTNA